MTMITKALRGTPRPTLDDPRLKYCVRPLDDEDLVRLISLLTTGFRPNELRTTAPDQCLSGKHRMGRRSKNRQTSGLETTADQH